MKLSTRNQWQGTVSNIVEGVVNSEVSVDLGGGAVVTSIVTKNSVKRLENSKGRTICAVIKASSLMIGKE